MPLSRKTLATTSLREFWGVRQPDVFLGKWCLRQSNDSEQPDLVARVLAYPWAVGGARLTAYRDCIDLKRVLLTEIAALLNAHHSVCYSLRSWNLLLGAWLQRLVMVSYHHSRCLEEAQREVPDAMVFGPVREASSPPSTSIKLFFDLQREYRHQEIFAHFAEEMGIPCERVPVSAVDLPNGQRPIVIDSIPDWIDWSYRKIRTVPKATAKFVARRATCVLYNATPTPREALQLALLSLLRVAPLPILSLDEVAWPKPDVELRKRISHDLLRRVSNGVFTQRLVSLLPSFLPISLLEGFVDLRRQVSEYFPRRPRRIISSMAWVGDDAFCLWAAEQSEKGTELVSAQHGGTYGVRAMLSGSELVESEVADKFLSWGPGTRVGANSVTLPVLPHFYTQRRRVKLGTLLFVAGISALLPPGFASAADGPDALDVVDRQKQFFTNLSDRYRQEFIVRPYPHDFGWMEEAKLEAAIPGLKFDDRSVGFIQRMSEARLVVSDNMHSTYMQAIGSGIPTVLFWDRDIWSVNGDAMPKFNRLSEAGILHSDPAKAAAKVTEIADDPMGWWRSGPVADAVASFVENYFYTTSRWRSAWVDELTV